MITLLHHEGREITNLISSSGEDDEGSLKFPRFEGPAVGDNERAMIATQSQLQTINSDLGLSYQLLSSVMWC